MNIDLLFKKQFSLNRFLKWSGIILVILSFLVYYHWYVPYRNLRNGFIVVSSFRCPADHPIKANLRSMIFHFPGDPYYNRTNAANGECFDTMESAAKQGFRASYNL